MRFGMFIPQGWRHDLVGIDPAEHWAVMRGLAERADAGPWESIWVYDHFHTVPAPTDQATHEAWALMSAFAATTSRVRLGQMCTCLGYRNPGVLAKTALTADLISGGRVELGIGAGWYEHEWRAYGFGFPDAPTRLRMLREGVEVLHQAFTTGRADFSGEFSDFDGAIFEPRSTQPGGLPIWVAGGGEKVTLKIAAKYADYTNFSGPLEDFVHKSAVLDAHCAALGRDPQEITRSANFNLLLAEDEAELGDKLAVLRERVLPHLGGETTERFLDDYRGTPGVGTPEQVAERLAERAAHGLAYTIVYSPEAAYDTRTLELFEQRVMPELG
ncbi:LLM class F420-dependent oxidoreductase [Agromyces seonyuensis]|uniref:TIGR03560 family F420-dependent LLM class oxidoreductase n=1 Tax=Agromyces seonyuensis TaxID=2662446 RepID=A0A6I4P258_9MICO|nr:LLM class F420-dependent oxidoreductase [Agromyces seonyuensis]MWB99682.1 TIGR03560 family F420-dependent LLM class oxidoreductase [Agromyces seonyuensis]